jgi:hypothetical protein
MKPTKKAGVKPHLDGKSDRKKWWPNGKPMCVCVCARVFTNKKRRLKKANEGLLKELQWAEVGRSGQNAEMMDSGIKPHLDGVPCRSAMGDLPSLAKD